MAPRERELAFAVDEQGAKPPEAPSLSSSSPFFGLMYYKVRKN